MEYRRLGASGLQVSVLGLGTNTVGPDIDQDTTVELLATALDLDINFIDTANVYSRGVSETYLGEAFRRLGRRSQAIIATKCGVPMSDAPNDGGTSRQHILESTNASLRRLQTDHIDLLQVHRFDPATPVEETLGALDDLVRAGKVRYTGCSNYAGWQLTEALFAAKAAHLGAFVSIQSEYNLLNRDIEREVLPVCQRYGVGIIPWAPLAAGFLTGKYRAHQDRPADSRGGRRPYWFIDRFLIEANYPRVERLQAFAEAQGHPLSELAIAWLVHRPAVSTVIVGASRPAQVAANVKALDWKLTPEVIAQAPEIAG